MNKTQETEEAYPRRDQFEDEVELIDYLRVIWKWKWLIIGGTLLCVLAAAIYGFTRPVVKMYKVSALLEIDPEAKLDPLDRIKSMIEYGIFNQQVLNDLSKLQGQGTSKPASLAFEVAIPKGLNILDIGYKTPNDDLGKAVLDSLAKRIKRNYGLAIEERKAEWEESRKKRNESIEGIQYEMELMKKQFEFNVLETTNKIKEHAQDIETLREKVNRVRNSIDLMERTLEVAQSNSAKLDAKRTETILDSQDEAGHVDIFLRASSIQQIIDYPIALRERIDSLVFKEKEFLSNILFSNNLIKKLKKSIEILKLNHESGIRAKEEEVSRLELEIETSKRDRDNITGVIVKQPPTPSLLPIKYKAKRNALLAGVVGFFFLIFLAFFIEYIKNAAKRTQKAV